MLTFALLLFPFLCQNKYAVNEVDSHNRSRQSDLALEKWRVTQCVWMQLFTIVYMGINITSFWKLFRYGVKRDRCDKLFCIRELLERLAQYCFNDTFSPDIRTPVKNIPPFGEVDYGDIVSTCCALQSSSCISPSAAVSTISDLYGN